MENTVTPHYPESRQSGCLAVLYGPLRVLISLYKDLICCPRSPTVLDGLLRFWLSGVVGCNCTKESSLWDPHATRWWILFGCGPKISEKWNKSFPAPLRSQGVRTSPTVPQCFILTPLWALLCWLLRSLIGEGFSIGFSVRTWSPYYTTSIKLTFSLYVFRTCFGECAVQAEVQSVLIIIDSCSASYVFASLCALLSGADIVVWA